MWHILLLWILKTLISQNKNTSSQSFLKFLILLFWPSWVPLFPILLEYKYVLPFYSSSESFREHLFVLIIMYLIISVLYFCISIVFSSSLNSAVKWFSGCTKVYSNISLAKVPIKIILTSAQNYFYCGAIAVGSFTTLYSSNTFKYTIAK